MDAAVGLMPTGEPGERRAVQIGTADTSHEHRQLQSSSAMLYTPTVEQALANRRQECLGCQEIELVGQSPLALSDDVDEDARFELPVRGTPDRRIDPAFAVLYTGVDSLVKFGAALRSRSLLCPAYREFGVCTPAMSLKRSKRTKLEKLPSICGSFRRIPPASQAYLVHQLQNPQCYVKALYRAHEAQVRLIQVHFQLPRTFWSPESPCMPTVS